MLAPLTMVTVEGDMIRISGHYTHTNLSPPPTAEAE